MAEKTGNTIEKLTPHVSVMGAWAMALGTSIGWGSMVVMNNSYLLQGGPVGSAVGLIVGAVIMLVIGRNYHYMINCYPDAGGVYAYTKEAFGYDYGFLISWFLALTYAAMFWANATSLPLFAHYFFGDIFRFGKLYTFFGYDVYIGEVILTIAAILLIALLCVKTRNIVMSILIVLAILFTAGIIINFAGGMIGHAHVGSGFAPEFIPDKKAFSQIIKIASISPWAFIGFENISHLSEEYTFPRKRVFSVFSLAVATATVLYVFVIFLSVSTYPPQYENWLAYIRDLGNLSGLEGLPAFYAAHHYLGDVGVRLLILTLLALIVTSLIGNTVAISRLLYALAKDNVIPKKFAKLNRRLVPGNAIILFALLSMFAAFVGRTAVGWIVDVTTIGAVLVYGFVSGSAWKEARNCGDKKDSAVGMVGLLLMIAFGAYLLVPNLFFAGSMEKESYFLFVVWAILGFLFFRSILKRDEKGRFGRSIVVWIVLLSLVLLIALIWMNQSMISSTNTAMENIHSYYHSGGVTSDLRLADETFIEEQIRAMRQSNVGTMLVVAGLFVFSLIIMFTNYSFMNKRARESELALGQVRNLANTDPLTGVKSKLAFAEYEKNLDVTIAGGDMKDFSVVVCDVNGLKHVNDTYGHKAGDAYIRSASQMICELFDHSPVFRVGGDEFVVILTDRDFERRDEIMKELHRRSEENIAAGKVVVAGGCSDFKEGTDQRVHDVFERADALMYQEKQALKGLGAKSR